MKEIFKFDGTLQCGLGSEISIEAMQAELEQLGLEIVSSEKRKWPFFVIQLCGAPTGQTNVFKISEDSFLKNQEALYKLGFQAWPNSNTNFNTTGFSGGGGEPGPWPLDSNYSRPSHGGDGFVWPWANGDNVAYPWLFGNIRFDSSKKLSEILGKRVRIYKLGDLITQDNRLDRVNIVLHRETLVIIDIWFG